MIGNWVKESTATTGTGDITLGGAIAGFIRFQDAGPVGVTFEYAIEDGTNREVGIGRLTAAGTLNRFKILATLSGGVYTRFPGTGIALSGSATVVATPSADMMGGMGAAMTTQSYGSSNTGQKRYTSGAVPIGARGSQGISAGTLYLMPFKLDVGMRLAALCTYVSTAAASQNILLGLYEWIPDGIPGKLLASTAAQSVAAAGYVRGTVTPIDLTPGWYWAGFLCSGTPSIQTLGDSYNLPMGVSAGDSRLTLTSIVTPISYASGLPTTAPAQGSYTPNISNNGNAFQMILEGA